MQTLFSRTMLQTLSLSAILVFASLVQAQNPVDVSVKISKPKDGQAELAVVMLIKDGWHTYATVPEDNPSPVTTVELELPDGVTAVGDWKRTKGKPYEGGMTVFKKRAKFTQKLKVTPAATDREVGVIVSYQVCNDKMCRPPEDFEDTVTIASSKEANSSSGAEKAPSEFNNEYFSTPEMLMVGETPLNSAAKQKYPSPAMYDVDNDGEIELIVGDIFGTLNVYENKHAGEKCDPVWQKHNSLKTAKEKQIKVSNW